MKVGFTGTQQGMTEAQLFKFVEVIEKLSPSELHHGDCIGCDEQAHDLFLGNKIIHPPINSSKRAFKKGKLCSPKPYLTRNKDIVDQTDILIATPKGISEELRSGTWSTVRYARKQKKRICIIFPNGEVRIE